MSDPLQRANAALRALESWFTEHVAPVATTQFPKEWQRWQKECSAIQETLAHPGTVRVAMVGTTGAGKSTFLNSLLGQEVLTVGTMSPVTAFVTLVKYRPGSDYRVEVQFASSVEWHRDIDRYLDALQPGDSDVDEVMKSHVNAMRKRIEAVLGTRLDDSETLPDLHAVELPAEARAVLAGPGHEGRTFDEPKAMRAYLKQFIHGKSALWPLVKQVTIEGPYDCLRGGVELVDLPGTNDANEARVEVTRGFLRSSPYVWLMFPMVRGMGRDIQDLLVQERLLRTLMLTGSFNALSLIGTKADDIHAGAAEDLGLEEDCEHAELIKAYREHACCEFRRQLRGFVEDMAYTGEEVDTRARLLELADKASIFTVSASAYNSLRKIGRSFTDYGLASVEDTGIPDVLAHLRFLASEVGAGLTGRTALQRVDQLREEVTLFFRARAAAGSPAVAQARTSLQEEVSHLNERNQRALLIARAQLEDRRSRFLGRMNPLLAKSISAVQRTTDGWQQIHWGTLRALVARDGVFKSPSNGRTYDLNADLTNPLLDQLPMAWERYFTDELGAVRDELVLRLTEAADEYCYRVTQLARNAGAGSVEMMERQIRAFRERVDFDRRESARRIAEEILERRRMLTHGMSASARQRLLPGYELAQEEHGPGMKGRMLAHLRPCALSAAPVIFQTIEHDLADGLSGLESLIARLFDALVAAAAEQAGLVAQNVMLDLDEARIPADIERVLATSPIDSCEEQLA